MDIITFLGAILITAVIGSAFTAIGFYWGRGNAYSKEQYETYGERNYEYAMQQIIERGISSIPQYARNYFESRPFRVATRYRFVDTHYFTLVDNQDSERPIVFQINGAHVLFTEPYSGVRHPIEVGHSYYFKLVPMNDDQKKILELHPGNEYHLFASKVPIE